MDTFENLIRKEQYWSDIKPEYSIFDSIDIWILSSIINGNYRLIETLDTELEKEYLSLLEKVNLSTEEGIREMYVLKGFEKALRILERDRGIPFPFIKDSQLEN